MPQYRKKPGLIEAYEFLGEEDDVPAGVVVVGSDEDGFEVWNDLHQSWIGLSVGDFLRTDLVPKDVYPIDRETFLKTYEPTGSNV